MNKFYIKKNKEKIEVFPIVINPGEKSPINLPNDGRSLADYYKALKANANFKKEYTRNVNLRAKPFTIYKDSKNNYYLEYELFPK